MDAGTSLASLYDPFMRACGWSRTQRTVLTGNDGRVLDVGCGPGSLARSSRDGYVGVDIRMAMLVRASHAPVICADAAALPFPDDTFDTVVSTAFLGLLSPAERLPVLREMGRVCCNRLRILEPMAPLGRVRRMFAFSRQPLHPTELHRAGWQLLSTGPRVYAGVYTLVCAAPPGGQSR